jgi:hypothetical protein
VYGGLGALAVAGIWAAAFPRLRNADELSSAALRPSTPLPDAPTTAVPE